MVKISCIPYWQVLGGCGADRWDSNGFLTKGLWDRRRFDVFRRSFAMSSYFLFLAACYCQRRYERRGESCSVNMFGQSTCSGSRVLGLASVRGCVPWPILIEVNAIGRGQYP